MERVRKTFILLWFSQLGGTANVLIFFSNNTAIDKKSPNSNGIRG